MSDAAPRLYGTERQLQIYLAGIQGQRPTTPMSYEQLEEQARQRLSLEAFGYVAGGAGGEGRRCAPDRTAFERWQIVPRMLRNVGERKICG